MSIYKYSNFVSANLETEIAATSTVLTVSVAAAEKMPQVDGSLGEVFALTLHGGFERQTPEIVLCTHNQGNGVLVVERGEEGTQPQSWPAGTSAVMAVTAGMLNQLANGREILLEASRYTYLAYADAEDGTGFTLEAGGDKEYVAFLVSPEKIEAPEAADFAGLWQKFRGAQGSQGLRGDPGVRGPDGRPGKEGPPGPQGDSVPAGSVMLTYADYAPDGWLLHEDGTIGDSQSGATDLADETAETLFGILWKISDVVYTNGGVETAKSADAATDFAAHRRVKLPPKAGMALAAGGGDFSVGEVGGKDNHSIVEDNIPEHRFYTVANSGSIGLNEASAVNQFYNSGSDPQNYSLTGASGAVEANLGLTNAYGKADPDPIPLKPRSAHFNLLVKL